MTDQSRLLWLRHNQSILRADVYNGLTDSLSNDDVDQSRLGQRFILPSSYRGGARSMNQLFHDSMAITRALRNNDDQPK